MKKLTTELNGFTKLGQMGDFTVANLKRFVPDTPAAKTAPDVLATISSLNTQTATQLSLEKRCRDLSRIKHEGRAALREELEFLYQTAQGIAAETPGFDDKFKKPLSGDQRLLAAARSALQDAAPLSEVFISHAIPSDFLKSLDTKIQDFKRASQEFANCKTACSSGDKALRQSLGEALRVGRRFNAIVRNTFRDDSITLAAWKTACRVPRRSKKEDTPAADGAKPPAQPKPQAEAQPPAA